jgi:hypothetical protein
MKSTSGLEILTIAGRVILSEHPDESKTSSVTEKFPEVAYAWVKGPEARESVLPSP